MRTKSRTTNTPTEIVFLNQFAKTYEEAEKIAAKNKGRLPTANEVDWANRLCDRRGRLGKGMGFVEDMMNKGPIWTKKEKGHDPIAIAYLSYALVFIPAKGTLRNGFRVAIIEKDSLYTRFKDWIRGE